MESRFGEEKKIDEAQVEEEKLCLEEEEEKEYEEFPWPCGFCHYCYDNQEDFDEHKIRTHSEGSENVKDHLDEKTFAKSDGPYHMKNSLINLNHEIDAEMSDKIITNPKALNSKAPCIQAASWGIYDVNDGDVILGKLIDNRREVASVTKTMTAFTITQIGI